MVRVCRPEGGDPVERAAADVAALFARLRGLRVLAQVAKDAEDELIDRRGGVRREIGEVRPVAS
jgi:hypothetical protein